MANDGTAPGCLTLVALAGVALCAMVYFGPKADAYYQAEEREKMQKNARIASEFTGAKTLTGKVSGFGYDDSIRKANLFVIPNNDPTNILTFNYHQGYNPFNLAYEGDLDLENVRKLKVGTRVTWKEGYRPFDCLIKSRNGHVSVLSNF